MTTFDPFSILPDDPAPAAVVVAEPVVEYRSEKRITPIMEKVGANGNNLPENIGEKLNEEIAKRREGRMCLFTPEKAAVILEGIEDGLTMDEIAKNIGHDRKVIWTWMQLSPEFNHAVAQAREYQGHSSADNAVKLLDEVTIDPENPKAAMAELRKAEQRARIRMDLAKAFNAKQYGDKRQNLNLNLNVDASPVDLSSYQM